MLLYCHTLHGSCNPLCHLFAIDFAFSFGMNLLLNLG